MFYLPCRPFFLLSFLLFYPKQGGTWAHQAPPWIHHCSSQQLCELLWKLTAVKVTNDSNQQHQPIQKTKLVSMELFRLYYQALFQKRNSHSSQKGTWRLDSREWQKSSLRTFQPLLTGLPMSI